MVEQRAEQRAVEERAAEEERAERVEDLLAAEAMLTEEEERVEAKCAERTAAELVEWAFEQMEQRTTTTPTVGRVACPEWTACPEGNIG